MNLLMLDSLIVVFFPCKRAKSSRNVSSERILVKLMLPCKEKNNLWTMCITDQEILIV